MKHRHLKVQFRQQGRRDIRRVITSCIEAERTPQLREASPTSRTSSHGTGWNRPTFPSIEAIRPTGRSRNLYRLLIVPRVNSRDQSPWTMMTFWKGRRISKQLYQVSTLVYSLPSDGRDDFGARTAWTSSSIPAKTFKDPARPVEQHLIKPVSPMSVNIRQRMETDIQLPIIN